MFSTSIAHHGLISHEDQIENLDPTTSAFYPLTPEAIRAIDAIEYITDHLKKDEEIKMQKDDWKCKYPLLIMFIGAICEILNTVFVEIGEEASMEEYCVFRCGNDD